MQLIQTIFMNFANIFEEDTKWVYLIFLHKRSQLI